MRDTQSGWKTREHRWFPVEMDQAASVAADVPPSEWWFVAMHWRLIVAPFGTRPVLL